MKRVKGLFLLGLSAAAGAAYFFDGQKGGKRRRSVRKQLEQAADITNGVVRDCSRKASTIASNFRKNGTAGWIPSPRLAGALGSMLTVYSSGRRGPVGTLLRILSLGLFTRALMTNNPNMKERLGSQKLEPSPIVDPESVVSRSRKSPI